jgi:hypothetical protein
LEFCQQFVVLNRKPISFEGRPYLPAIYAARRRNLVLRCSRQTEKSTLLVNTILFEACTNPGIQMLFVCPRTEQAQTFSKLRLLPAVEKSPLIRRRLLGRNPRRPPVMNLRFANDSTLSLRAAYHSGDACRGLSADLLLVDEFQDIAEGDLPVLQETLSHSENRRTILTGTPKSIDNHLESMFRLSTANEWTVACAACSRNVIFDEHCLGPQGIICPECGGDVDPRRGRWIPRNMQSTWGDGFWICHPMVPWLNYDDILESRHSYDLAKFKNEVLGLPTTAGEHVVTRAELEACCGDRPMANSLDDIPPQARRKLIVGIDWGGGERSRTVVALGYMEDDFRFRICRFERLAATEEPDSILEAVVRFCTSFRVELVAADGGGNGHVYNRMLVQRLRLRGLYAILYSTSDHAPRQEGVLLKLTVNRSAWIGAVFSRIKKQQMIFPCLAESGSFLDEFAAEIAVYDDNSRTVRYSHPETQQDDALHATTYALVLALRAFHAMQQQAYGSD